MIPPAYIDIRPFIFIGGLPLFTGLFLLTGWLAGTRFRKRTIAIFSAVLFSILFSFFLTGMGPFIDQKEIREYMMTWVIKPEPANGMKESEVVLHFVDFPNDHIGDYSDELAAHLRRKGTQKVNVVFEVTSDYGKVRGFKAIEIAGLRAWRSEWGYAGSSGSGGPSPWD